MSNNVLTLTLYIRFGKMYKNILVHISKGDRKTCSLKIKLAKKRKSLTYIMQKKFKKHLGKKLSQIIISVSCEETICREHQATLKNVAY